MILKKYREINSKHEAALCYNIIFIDCNGVSTRWQWSINLYKKWEKDSYIQKEK